MTLPSTVHPDDQSALAGFLSEQKRFLGSKLRLTGDASQAWVVSYTTDLDGSYHDIQPNDITHVHTTAAGQLSVVSSDAADTAAGTGARMILVDGIGMDGMPHHEFIELNGVTPVNSSDFLAVNITAIPPGGTGSARTNVGVLSVSIGGVLQNITPIGTSLGQSSHRTLSIDEIGIVERFRYFWAGDRVIRVQCPVRTGYLPGTTTVDGTISVPITVELDHTLTGGDVIVSPIIPPAHSTWCRGQTSSPGQGGPFTLGYMFRRYRFKTT